MVIQAFSQGGSSIFTGKVPMLKSTQEKMERQQKMADQVDFWEGKKEALKNVKCNTIEDIAKKLEQFETYENQIASAKKAYNHEQMFHSMDEARERGEKIAEMAEKYEPKTAEEQREELAEEALGTEENESELMESLEDVSEELTEETEELSEEMLEQLSEEKLDGEMTPEDMALLLKRQKEQYQHIDFFA